MSNTITGDELWHPIVHHDNTHYGATLRQKALLEFMCAIVKNNEYSIDFEDSDFVEDISGKYVKADNRYRYQHSPTPQSKTFTLITTAEQRIAREADRHTTAYINQLNKQP